MTRRKETRVGEEGKEKDELTQIVIIVGTALTNNIIRNLTSANNQVNWREKTPQVLSGCLCN